MLNPMPRQSGLGCSQFWILLHSQQQELSLPVSKRKGQLGKGHGPGHLSSLSAFLSKVPVSTSPQLVCCRFPDRSQVLPDTHCWFACPSILLLTAEVLNSHDLYYPSETPNELAGVHANVVSCPPSCFLFLEPSVLFIPSPLSFPVFFFPSPFLYFSKIYFIMNF